jgi:hypothetical protein
LQETSDFKAVFRGYRIAERPSMRILWTLLALLVNVPAFAQYSVPAPVFSNVFGGTSGSDAATTDGPGRRVVRRRLFHDGATGDGRKRFR